MKTCLIGYSGFVGGNIAKQSTFDEYFNSENIDSIRAREYSLVVCAGVPGVKWFANENPREDFDLIKRLRDVYASIHAQRFVLISTVDVYPNPISVDEFTHLEPSDCHPYGKHRLWLERELSPLFDKMHIVRLPGLFGIGQKKNVLFDLMSKNLLNRINLASRFQWYPLARIWGDICKVIDNDLPLVNFSVQPIETKVIHSKFFSALDVGSDPSTKVTYDMHSRYSVHFGGHGQYFLDCSQVLKALKGWLISSRVSRAKASSI